MKFKNWYHYFLSNQHGFSKVAWDKKSPISAVELDNVKESIRQFQKGESSAGKNLLRLAKDHPDPHYSDCISLFVKEEQEHARALGRFLDIYEVDRMTEHWTDTVFRRLRRAFGLEHMIMVLLTAELISSVYYRALRNSTNCQMLRDICQRVLKDEGYHLAFQCCLLNEYHSAHRSHLKRLAHRCLLGGTAIIVWLYHKKVLRRGDFTFLRYWNALFQVFNKTNDMITGQRAIPVPAVSTLSKTA